MEKEGQTDAEGGGQHQGQLKCKGDCRERSRKTELLRATGKQHRYNEDTAEVDTCFK